MQKIKTYIPKIIKRSINTKCTTMQKHMITEWQKQHFDKKIPKIINPKTVILSKGSEHFLHSLFSTLRTDAIFIPKHCQYHSYFDKIIRPKPDFYQNIVYKSAILSFIYPISTLNHTYNINDISYTQFIDKNIRILDSDHYGENITLLGQWFGEYVIIVDPINISEKEVLLILNWLTELQCAVDRYVIIDSLNRDKFNFKLLPLFKSNKVFYMNTYKSSILPFNIGINIIPDDRKTNLLLSSKLLKDIS
jgi:hypothetical protein